MAVEKSERLVNLTMALLATKRPLRKGEIFSLVQGYDGSAESSDRMFERDKDDLRQMGVPISVVDLEAGMDSGYRIFPDEYALPPLHLSHEESALLAVAADAWKRSGFSGISVNTILKLRGAGVPVLDVIDNRVDIAYTPSWRFVAEAIIVRQAISFDYRRRDGHVDVRLLEPYAMHFRAQRWYVVGFDRDRGEIRTFVLSRFLGGLSPQGNEGSFAVPPDFDSSRHLSRSDGVTRTFTIVARGGALTALRNRAIKSAIHQDGSATLSVNVDDETEFLFELLTLTPMVEILAPLDVRTAVLEMLGDSHAS